MTTLQNSSIPPFPGHHLTSNNFKWLHEKGWTDEDTDWFARHRAGKAAMLYRTPVIHRHRGSNSFSRWVLRREEQIQAWAEVQVYHGSFRRVFLFAGFAARTGDMTECIALLVSGIFILSEGDLIQLFPVCAPAAPDIPTAWGYQGEVYTMFDACDALPSGPPGSRVIYHGITRGDWWEQPAGKSSRLQLLHLEKALEDHKTKKMQALIKKRPRRGLPFRLIPRHGTRRRR